MQLVRFMRQWRFLEKKIIGREMRTSICLAKKRVQPISIPAKSAKVPLICYSGMNVRQVASALDMDVLHLIRILRENEFFERENIDESMESRLQTPKQFVSVAAYFDRKLKLVAAPKSSQNDHYDQLDLDVKPLPAVSDGECQQRAPVVAIMGHVDHGKTTLLDALRHSSLVQAEAGAITQHIGAFSVTLPIPPHHTITFLDTPGHAAFGAMRRRGAMATDLVVLVVAADEGVKQETIQSIRFAKVANVPIIVALNKMDRPGANAERTKRMLLSQDVIVEDFNGDVQAIEISALKQTNLVALQEAIVAQAEIMNLRATRTGFVQGVILESSSKMGSGCTATVLIERGTLSVGDILVAGQVMCRVRTMSNELGQSMNAAGPSTPVVVFGWHGETPSPGETVIQVESQVRAEKAVAYRKKLILHLKADEDSEAIDKSRSEWRSRYEKLMEDKLSKGYRYKMRRKDARTEMRVLTDDTPRIYVMIRGDVEGSVEAIMNVIESYNDKRCKLSVVDCGVGELTIADIQNAAYFNAHVYCFNVDVSEKAQTTANEGDVDVRRFNVIYHLVEDLKKLLTAALPLLQEECLLGEATVIREFRISDGDRKKQPIAGCLVQIGVIERKARIRFSRDGTTFYDGDMEALKVEQDVVETVTVSQEVGVSVSDKSVRFRKGDLVQCYRLNTVSQEIVWTPQGF